MKNFKSGDMPNAKKPGRPTPAKKQSPKKTGKPAKREEDKQTDRDE